MNAWRPTLYAYSPCQSATFPVSRGLTADRRIGIASWSFLIRLPRGFFSVATPEPPARTDGTSHRAPVADRAQLGGTAVWAQPSIWCQEDREADRAHDVDRPPCTGVYRVSLPWVILESLDTP